MKSRKHLSKEDRRLWTRVAKSTVPLSRERDELLKSEMERLMGDGALRHEPASTPLAPMSFRGEPPSRPIKPASLQSHPIEERIAKRLARGRQQIDSRIDLHGMTQDRARFALLDFLKMAQQADHRIVLVITGKGNEGRGVLRRAVPQWFALPAFKLLVNGYREAHVSHGGEGALYVRVRRRK